MLKISWRKVLPFVLTAFFVVGSRSNIVAPGAIYEEYLKWGYPPWVHFFTGTMELTAAILLLRKPTRLSGALLWWHRHVRRTRDRRHPRRIRARRASTRRGDVVTCRWLDKGFMIVAVSRSSFAPGHVLIHGQVQLSPPPQTILWFHRTDGRGDHAFKYQLERFLRLIAHFEPKQLCIQRDQPVHKLRSG